MSSAPLLRQEQRGMILHLRFSVAAGMLFIWSMVGFPLVASTLNALGLPSTEIVIVARMIVLAISILMIGARLATRRFPHSASFVLFLLFFAVYTMRMAHDTAFVPHLLGRPGYMYWAFSIGVCFAPALALALYARHLTAPSLYLPLMLLCGIVLVLALTVGSTRMVGSGGDDFDSGRLALESLNPISLGHLGASVFILAYWRTRMLGRTLGDMLRTLPIALLGVYVLFASGSRGPLVALILAIMFFEAVKGGRTAIVLAVALAPFLALLTFDFDRLGMALGTNLFSRIGGAIEGTDAASVGRLDQASSAWDLFLNAPLFGAALEDPTFKIYPHNIVVEAFMATGIFGGTLLLLLLGITGWRAFQIARASPVLSIYGALFVQYTIAAQFSGSIYTSSTTWALIACILGTAIPHVNIKKAFCVSSVNFESEHYKFTSHK